jgi:hypothetical protein
VPRASEDSYGKVLTDKERDPKANPYNGSTNDDTT